MSESRKRLRALLATPPVKAPEKRPRVGLVLSGGGARGFAHIGILRALEEAGVAVPNLCRQGVCGECRVPVRAGRPLHRDLYLSEAERAAGDAVMCCVSRSLDDELELDL